MNPREATTVMLMECIGEGKPSHTVLNRTIREQAEWSACERSFAKRLFSGTLERLLTIDFLISQVSTVKVAKMKPWILMNLRVGIYQLVYMDGIPASAACNETVKLVKKRGFTSLSGFVNGVLRRIDREKEILLAAVDALSEDEQASIRYSVPVWLFQQWKNDYGKEIAEAIAKAQFREQPVTIRHNLTRGTKEELMHSLEAEGVVLRQADYVEECLHLIETPSIEGLSSFREGAFCVQDESSALVGCVAGAFEGTLILDVCAAPGGKTVHVADLLMASVNSRNNGQRPGVVISRDISDYKLQLIEENCSRCKLSNVKIQQWDAEEFDPSLLGAVDIVLADLPCSGTGVIGKKPDIKYKMSEAQQQELVLLQRRILYNCVKYLKAGGILIYSTCTLNKKENIENRAFILNELHLKPESIAPYLPLSLFEESLKEGYLQLIPGKHTTDGFFVAGFRK